MADDTVPWIANDQYFLVKLIVSHAGRNETLYQHRR